MRQCTKCGQKKPLNSFTLGKSHGKEYRYTRCKLCDYLQVKKTRMYLLKKRSEKYGLSCSTIIRHGIKLALFVYDRAKRKCQKCNSAYDLTIHHIDRKGSNLIGTGKKRNNNPDNLIILCRKCHGRIHGFHSGEVRRQKALNGISKT
jgi:hypothetical protein